MIRRRLHNRVHFSGLHGHKRVQGQRRIALLMIFSGLARVAIWLTIALLFVFRVQPVVAWFQSVAFVSLLSIIALVLTDWGQVAASLAQLTAGDAHHDAEAAREAVDLDYSMVEHDIARLAELQPGEEAKRLAQDICARFSKSHDTKPPSSSSSS